jgi:hypothetical protein
LDENLVRQATCGQEKGHFLSGKRPFCDFSLSPSRMSAGVSQWMREASCDRGSRWMNGAARPRPKPLSRREYQLKIVGNYAGGELGDALLLASTRGRTLLRRSI